MKNTFTIQYQDAGITVEELGGNEYIAHLPDGDLHLHHTEDAEGAGRWIDKHTNHETEVSGEVGQQIELEKVKNHC